MEKSILQNILVRKIILYLFTSIMVNILLSVLLSSITSVIGIYIISLIVVIINVFLFGFIFLKQRPSIEENEEVSTFEGVIHHMTWLEPLTTKSDVNQEDIKESENVFDLDVHILEQMFLTNFHVIKVNPVEKEVIENYENQDDCIVSEDIIEHFEDIETLEELEDPIDNDMSITDEIEEAIDLDEEPLFEYDVPDDYIPPFIFDDAVIYQKPENLFSYLDRIYENLKEHGIDIKKNSLREIFAAMATSKLIIIKHHNPNIAKVTMKHFFELIGVNFIESISKRSTTEFIDLFDSNHFLSETMDHAFSNRNTMNVFNIDGVDLRTFEQDFYPINEFAINPHIEVPFEINDGTPVHLPINLWFTIFVKANDNTVYSERLSQGAVTIELDSEVRELTNNIRNDIEKISFDSFNDILMDGYEEYYMDEIFWKSIDEMEYFINSYSKFRIGNRLFRQLERFSSVFLIFGGEKVDVIDSLLISKLMNILATIDFTSLKKQKQDIVLYFDKLFGLENITRFKGFLKEIQDHAESFE